MSLPPLPYVYEGNGVFRAVGRHAPAVLADALGQGQVVRLVEQEERSEVSHRHEFAWLRTAWQSLPEHLADEYPSAEALRKKALIATGWAIVRDYPCTSRAEAQRLAASLRGEVDEYAVVIVRDDVVRVCRAKSQAKNKMNAADFRASKEAVLGWVSDLLGVEPDQLERARAA